MLKKVATDIHPYEVEISQHTTLGGLLSDACNNCMHIIFQTPWRTT